MESHLEFHVTHWVYGDNSRELEKLLRKQRNMLCTGCNEELSVCDFSKHHRSKKSLNPKCRACQSAPQQQILAESEDLEPADSAEQKAVLYWCNDDGVDRYLPDRRSPALYEAVFHWWFSDWLAKILGVFVKSKHTVKNNKFVFTAPVPSRDLKIDGRAYLPALTVCACTKPCCDGALACPVPLRIQFRAYSVVVQINLEYKRESKKMVGLKQVGKEGYEARLQRL